MSWHHAHAHVKEKTKLLRNFRYKEQWLNTKDIIFVEELKILFDIIAKGYVPR